jgi:hypothetical protein
MLASKRNFFTPLFFVIYKLINNYLQSKIFFQQSKLNVSALWDDMDT